MFYFSRENGYGLNKRWVNSCEGARGRQGTACTQDGAGRICGRGQRNVPVNTATRAAGGGEFWHGGRTSE